MKKYILLLFALLALSQISKGQQMGLYSQYMLNDFAINPAMAGVKSYIPVQITMRRQWFGIEDAPVTQSIISHAYIGGNMGIGINVFNQSTGPTKRTGLSFSTAYHIAFEDSRNLSFGLAPVVYQYRLHEENLTPENPDDPAITNAFNNQLVPDANFGVFFSQGNQYYVGLAAHNLIQSKIDLFNTTERSDNMLMRTFYLTGGYNYEINEMFMPQAGLIIQKTLTAPMQLDISARLFYRKMVWLGVSYRTGDAVVAYAGVKTKSFLFGYSYDITTSDIRQYSSGTHEITMALHLSTGGGRGKRRGGFINRSFTPSMEDF